MARLCLALLLLATAVTIVAARPYISPAPRDNHQYVRDLFIRLGSRRLQDRMEAEGDLFHHGPLLSHLVLDVARDNRAHLPDSVIWFLVDKGKREGRIFVRRLLKDKTLDSHTRGQAARALTRKRDFYAFPYLLVALEQEGYYLRLSAARCLGNLGSRRALRHLVRCFRNETSQRVTAEIALALYKLGDTRGISFLGAHFRGGSTRYLAFENVRANLLTIAAEWPRYAQIGTLARSQQDTLLENWLYEWDRGLLTARSSPMSPRSRARP